MRAVRMGVPLFHSERRVGGCGWAWGRVGALGGLGILLMGVGRRGESRENNFERDSYRKVPKVKQ